MNKDDFTVLISRKSKTALNEHVHCVAVAFKMTE